MVAPKKPVPGKKGKPPVKGDPGNGKGFPPAQKKSAPKKKK